MTWTPDDDENEDLMSSGEGWKADTEYSSSWEQYGEQEGWPESEAGPEYWIQKRLRDEGGDV